MNKAILLLSLLEKGLSVTDIKVDNKTLSIKINGKQYKYKPTPPETIDSLEKSFRGIFKYSPGKALAWLKKNSTCEDISSLGAMTKKNFTSGEEERLKIMAHVGSSYVLW